MSRVELLALAHGLTVMLKLSDNFIIAVNEKGESFAVYTLPKKKPLPRGRLQRLFLVPSCNGICGFNLKRRHLTCSVCRWKKIREGKLPAVVPVTVYFLSMGKNRRFEKLQGWLSKKVAALQEFVSLYGENSRS
jgi:hypothetical protein